MNDLKTRIGEAIIEKQSRTDYLTIFLIGIMLTLHGSVIYWQLMGYLSFLVATLACCLIMNMSFTFWHECCHENLSRNRMFNQSVGIITSFFSFFPGYYARRREHLVHHKFEGVPGKDPVYFRIQNTSFRKFLWTAVVVNYLENRPDEVPSTFLPLSRREKIIDKITVGLVWLVIFFLVSAGKWEVALATIVIPRVFIFIYHAYVICFFPHFVPEGGYRKYRAYPHGLLVRILTMNQAYHGIHHYSPKVRWYNYPLVHEKFKTSFSENEIELK